MSDISLVTAMKAQKMAKQARSGVKTVKLDIPVVNVAIITTGVPYYIPFDMEYTDTINRIQLYIGTSQNVSLMQIGIYDASYNKICDSGAKEMPLAGLIELALPDTLLSAGRYYVALIIQSSATTVTFGTNPYIFGATGATTFPLPASATNISLVSTVPSIVVKSKSGQNVKGLFAISTMNVSAYNFNPVTGDLWGADNSYFYYSTDSSTSTITWTKAMPVPPMQSGDAINDIVFHNNQLYVLTYKSNVFRSSDLTASAIWTDITCPAPMKNPNAMARPYGLAVFNGFIYQGEYSVASIGELGAGGDPKILKYDPTTNNWSISAQFPNARHIHSFYVQGTSAMWVSLGDANFGSDIGIWRMTTSQQGTASGVGVDTWTRWTNINAPNNQFYPVDFFVSVGNTNMPDGLYCSSDRPGKHVFYVKTTGTAGAFNINNLIYQPAGGDTNETVRGIIRDSVTGNLYWMTTETTEPGIWMAKAPYTQGYKVYSFPTIPAFVGRTIQRGSYMYNWKYRWSIEKFAGQ